jgi:hypothetical protein
MVWMLENSDRVAPMGTLHKSFFTLTILEDIFSVKH